MVQSNLEERYVHFRRYLQLFINKFLIKPGRFIYKYFVHVFALFSNDKDRLVYRYVDWTITLAFL